MEADTGQIIRVGVIGSGFVARGFTALLARHPRYRVSCVLTRRELDGVTDLGLSVEPDILTNFVDKLIDQSDVVVECSGDSVHATAVLYSVLTAGIPVVTMDAELHITTGTWLSRKGLLTEAEGDQPGSLAALQRDVLNMGFRPLVYGNVKGFLNHDPTREEMAYWAERNGISLQQVTSFTDGTKVQVEQVLVANGLGADIAQEGFVAYPCETMQEGANYLAELAMERDSAISDFIVTRDAPASVFIAGTHEDEQAPFLRYYKLGDGPYYSVVRPYHLCHLEIPNTLDLVMDQGEVLLDNSPVPRFSVGAIAKRDMQAGELLEYGVGSFDVRGTAVRIAERANHVPIGLISDVELKHNVERGQLLTFDDLYVPETLALTAWQEILASIL